MKKLIAWVLTLAMLLSIMPTAVFAQDSVTPPQDSVTDPVVFTKTLIQATATQPAKIRLEAYTTGSSTTSEAKLPTDIILVLDQSGSMDETMNKQTRLAVMKAAAEQFVADVAEMNNEAGDLYRVAIVGFASESGYNDNTEILTATRTQTVTNITYQRVQGELDTDQTYYIRSGQDYRAIEYNTRNNGWYTTGRNPNEVDVSRTAVYERVQETSELESIGVPYNDLTSNDYSAALVNCTDAAIGDNGVIGKAIVALEGEGATRTDLGMEMAAEIFEAQPEGTYDNRGKVVVLITDGVPTTFDTFDDGVANAAVADAKQMKDDGTYVFSMYLGNPSNQSVNFLQACSSNYPDATSISRLGTKAAESYYSAHSDASAIEAMFKGIANSITANSTLNERAVVTDTLSPYFKLAADLQTTGTKQIEVYTVDKTANGWADTEVPFAPAKVSIGGEDNRTISVTGFNFAAHCVTEDPKGGTDSTDYGKKLVIYIPIVEDPEADTFGGWLPTNENAGIYPNESAEEPAITAASGHDDVTIRYALNAAERAFHVDGTLLSEPVEFAVTFEELMNAENSVFDEMVNRLPDGLRNEGVTMSYKLYDIGTTDRESNDRNDDVLVAELTTQVAAGSEVDVTDYSKWIWRVDKAEMTIPANEYFAEKVYVLVCTLTSTAADDALTVYNYLDLSAVRGDLAHIIYGTIDEGGKVTVSDNTPGSILGNTYTEAVTEGNDSALMTFIPQESYEIESIEYHTSTEAPFDTAHTIYSKDPNAVITNVDLDGDGNADAAQLHEDGSWSFQAHNVTHGVAVEVNTRRISYTLTTNSDEGSEIINGTTYTYHATETFNVPFQAINGYYLDELKVNDTVYDLTSESDREALMNAYDAEFTMAKSADADVVVGGHVEVPRTRDNDVEVSSDARSYHVTLKYYIQNSDGSYTEQTAMQEGPTAVVYGTRIMDTEAPAYMPGAVKVFDEHNYTMSDWYNTNNGTEFYGLVVMEEAHMPANDLTLHAVWTRNPDVKIADLTISKTIHGEPGDNANFDFVALYHENLAGEAEIQFAAEDTVSTKDEMMSIILTDRQAESFREGNGNIYIYEKEPSGYSSYWLYDNVRYVLKWDENANDGQGGVVLYLNNQVVSDNVAAFENERVTFNFTFDANGGAWSNAVAGYDMGEGNATATTEGYFGDEVEEIAVKPVRDGYTFVGWYTDEDPAVQLWTGDNTTVNLYQNTTVYAKWEVDEFNDEKDEPTGGDDIPDYKQVQFLYEAGENGSVAPVREIVTIGGTNYTDVTVSATNGSEATADSGYALDKWAYEANDDANAEAALNQESSKILPTISNADGGKTYTFKATFAEDKKGNEDDGGEDGIPDKYQVFVEFRSANEEQGTVTGKIRQTFTFDEESGNVTPSLDGVTVTAAEGYAFDYWTKDALPGELSSEDVETTIENVSGNTTIVFTANFAVDTWTDADETDDPEDEDTDEKGDDIPDNRQVLINYVSENAQQGTVAPALEIITLKNGKGPEDIAAVGAEAVAEEGFTFVHWMNTQGAGTIAYTPAEPVIAPEIKNAVGGEQYTFTAIFAEDVLDDPTVDPDPEEPGDDIPDKYQVVVTYKVEGGYWKDQDNADKTAVFTYYAQQNDGSWEQLSDLPTLGGSIPDVSDAQPDGSHQTPAYWSPIPNVEDIAEDGAVYTYTFTQKGDALSFTFDANGGAWSNAVAGYDMGEGNATATTEGYFGDEVEEIAVKPVRDGYTFLGWYTTKALTAQLWTRYNPTVNLYENTTVYAKWEEIPEPPQPEVLSGNLYVNLQDENGTALADLVEISIEESYLIAQDNAEADYEIPASLEYNGKKYLYDGIASGELSGKLTKKDEIVVVCLRYAVDELNGEKDEPTGGDDIPDYKQVQFLYEAGENGSVAPALEIVTIDGTNYTDVTVSATNGSKATAEEGYALDKWTYEANDDANAEAALNQEGSKILPTISNADGGKTYTFKATFAEDKKGDEDDGGEDDIPDKYQVFVEFRSANEEEGTVTGKIRQTFTFDEESGDVAPSLDGVRVRPGSGYAFDFWNKDNGVERLDDADVQSVIRNVSGGTTIVFTANFALDTWTDAEETEDPEDDDTDVTGDGISDYLQFRVQYFSEDLKQGAVEPEVEIFTLKDDVEEYAAKGSTAVAKPHYAFDHWNYNGDATADFDPSQATIAPKLSNVTGGATYTFSAVFGEDNQIDPGVDPDPEVPGDEVPDQYQAVVTYRVVGGFWADGSDDDIVKVFTLYTYEKDDATGEWSWNEVVPAPVLGEVPEVTASDMHTGAWDAEISANTPVTKDVTYTYTFTPLPTYEVSYDLNGGTGAQDVDYSTVRVVEGTIVTVKAAPTLEGSIFKGYLVGETAYQPGDSITITADVVLIAQWETVVPGTGTITLTKVDSADNTTTLPNVVFDLYHDDGTKVGTYTTDKNGEITVEDLPAGQHYWVEIRPAEGYQLDSTRHEFTVNGGETTSIAVENTRTPVPEVFSGEHYAYIIGKNDGLVHPEDNITRAEVATIFFRLLDEETRSKHMTKTNNFTDVPEGVWYNTAVSTMAAMGIIKGTPDGRFQPNKNITRAEFATIAARFDTNGNTTGASFTDIYGHWAQKEINIAANNGWVLGYVDGEFRPDQDISRAEAMAMVNRVLQRIPQSQEDLLPEMVTWPDNMVTSKWYYLTVQEATNSHAYERKPNGYEFWTELQEVPDWSAFEK